VCSSCGLISVHQAECDVSNEDPNWWSCPYCGGANSFDAESCVHCGARLRDPDASTLFTTVAVDNAEVVPAATPFGPDSMWSTAPAPEPPSGSVIDVEVVEEPPVFTGPSHQPTGHNDDTNGLAAAIGRLSSDRQDAAVVPFSVCATLIASDEIVLAAVAGQMLGQAAAVVLTTRRILVVNSRRWQPIIDIYHLGPDLLVRERHDRDVASLTFSQGDRLSTVDAIAEVGIAVELAERLRR